METVEVYHNQYTQGGAVIREKWELVNADDFDLVYGSCGSLGKRTIEIPEGWSIGKDFAGEKALFDSEHRIVQIKQDKNGFLFTYAPTEHGTYIRRFNEINNENALDLTQEQNNGRK